MLVPLGVAVGEERRTAAAEARWHEARALDTDVAATGQPRYGQGGHRAIRPDGEDPPARFAGGDEVAAVAAERGGSDRDAALHGRGMSGDRLNAAGAVDGQHGRLGMVPGGDKELVTEMPDGVERDPVWHVRGWQGREPPGQADRANPDDSWAPSQLKGEDHPLGERAPRAGDLAPASQRDVRLTPHPREVATRPTRERLQRARGAHDEQAPGGSHSERAVTPRPGQIEHSRDMPETNPVPRRRGGTGPAGGTRGQRHAPGQSEDDGPHKTALHNAPTLRSRPPQPAAPREQIRRPQARINAETS